MNRVVVGVVPLPSNGTDELKFDIIWPSKHVTTVSLDFYAIRQYKGLSISEVIEQIVLDKLQDMCQTDSELVDIVFY